MCKNLVEKWIKILKPNYRQSILFNLIFKSKVDSSKRKSYICSTLRRMDDEAKNKQTRGWTYKYKIIYLPADRGCVLHCIHVLSVYENCTLFIRNNDLVFSNYIRTYIKTFYVFFGSYELHQYNFTVERPMGLNKTA